MSMISLQVPDSMVSELQRISATSGVSRSELVREALHNIIEHYDRVDDEPSCKEILMEIKAEIKHLTKVQ